MDTPARIDRLLADGTERPGRDRDPPVLLIHEVDPPIEENAGAGASGPLAIGASGRYRHRRWPAEGGWPTLSLWGSRPRLSLLPAEGGWPTFGTVSLATVAGQSRVAGPHS